jgi:hypothetical protein
MRVGLRLLPGLLRLSATIAGLIASLTSCAAADPSDPNVATLELSGQWSDVVDHLRGRLVAEPFLDPQGRSSVRIYLELQNLSFQPATGLRLTINKWGDLNWTLVDGHGNALPVYDGPPPYFLDFPTFSYAIILPPDSRLRFFVASGTYDTVAPSSVRVFYVIGPGRPWLLAHDRSAKYSLGAVFKVNESSAGLWSGQLTLPRFALPIPAWSEK